MTSSLLLNASSDAVETAWNHSARASLAIAPPSPHQIRTRLGDLLIHAGVISASDLEAALEQQQTTGTRLGEVLTRMGLIDEHELLPFIEVQLGLPAVRLREGLIDPEVVRMLPRQKAEQMHAIALMRVRNTLTVAFADPLNLCIVDEVERITGLRIQPVFALQSAIESLIPRCYEENFSVDAVTADIGIDAIEFHPDAITIDLQEVKSMAEGSPVVNLVNYAIVHAVRQGASDIHIEPGHNHSSIRFRVDGQLREVLTPRREFHSAIVSRIKVMAKMDIAEQRMPQDGRMHVVVERREIDLRCSTLPTVLGEKVVLRVLDRANITFHLDQLGMPDHQLKMIKGMLSKPHGLLLATGPTGSGKTTTLYSAIELIKSVHRNIVTVEDPVEYQLDLINQVQTSSTRSMSFAHILRSILRQDPDVIMVGEIRDVETAEIAIQAALTGHLVLSTLHTNDSASAVTRLVDMGVAPFKIAAALVGVVAQRLVRTICPHCRTTYYPPAEYLQMLHYTGDRQRQFHRGDGCPQCFDTGFQGRLGIYEVLPAIREIRDLIACQANLETLRDACARMGGTTLLQEGIRLAEAGKTSLEEVVRVALTD